MHPYMYVILKQSIIMYHRQLLIFYGANACSISVISTICIGYADDTVLCMIDRTIDGMSNRLTKIVNASEIRRGHRHESEYDEDVHSSCVQCTNVKQLQ